MFWTRHGGRSPSIEMAIKRIDLANHALRGLRMGLFEPVHTFDFSRRFSASLRLGEPNQSKGQLNSCRVTKVVSVNAEHPTERLMMRPGDVKTGTGRQL